MYDENGNRLYFYILPYLKVDANDIKGAYRSEYRLAADENGNLYVRNVDDGEDAANTCFTFEGDANASRWHIVSDNTAQLGLVADIDGNYTVKMGTSYTSWHVKTICLNVEKRYQEKMNTCGASTTLMLLDYLRPDHGLTEKDFVEIMKTVSPADNPVSDLGWNKNYINPEYGLSYVYDYGYFSMDVFYKHTVNSLNQGFPVDVQIKSVTQNDKVLLGYTGSNHYIVVKGIVYNPMNCTYDVIANDCHYKFGPDDDYDGKVYNDIGGRDLVVTWDIFHSLYEQSEEAMLFVP